MKKDTKKIKTLYIVVPCYNEEENVVDIGNSIEKEIREKLDNNTLFSFSSRAV